jgi:DNA-binding transcriptional LysR family regulator
MIPMRDAHLRTIDLNLLRSLQPLLEERHVSRAAKRAFLSQPAMSRTLDRLRDAFGDPLLVRSGRAFERTPRAERVLREIEPVMRRIEAIVREEAFSPAQSRERFRLSVSDNGAEILLPKLLERLRKQAPQCELVVSNIGPRTFDDLLAGRIDLDLCIEEAPAAVESEVLFTLDFICLVGGGQKLKTRRLTLKQYLQLPHAMILTGEGHQAMVDRPLAALGLKRQVALSIPFFLPALFAIAQTDLVLTVPRALTKMAVRQAKLQVVEAPRELKPFPYFMTWHPRLINEPAHAWLRDQVRAVARSIRTK